jgi:hypothetical protein
MSNVHQFRPKLTFNRRFIEDFVNEDAPCCALGLIEERQQSYAVLALNLGVSIPPGITASGFELGHSLLGDADHEVIHFAFDFRGFETYNVLLNPNNPLVQYVVNNMVQLGGYFILILDQNQHVTAFRADIGQQDLMGLSNNYRRIKGSTTTPGQYQKTLQAFNRRPRPMGQTLEWVCRDDMGYLDLRTDRMEVSPAFTPDAPLDEEDSPETEFEFETQPQWQPLPMLATIAQIIDGEVESSQELCALLRAARHKPHVLDDDTVFRATRLSTSQLEFMPIYREQAARWQRAASSPTQREALSRMTNQIDQLEIAATQVLALAKELESGTIDAILRMDDMELGLAVLMGQIKPPR